MTVQVIHGDMLSVLPTLDADSIDAVVTDPPYHLTGSNKTSGFMGKAWDGGNIAMRPDTWTEVLRVLKPGGHMLAFGGSRTQHRMACAIEDAGFEIRDTVLWLYGSGFPKSLDVSKAIDKSAGAKREIVGFDSVKAERFAASLGRQNVGWDRPWMHEADAVARKGNITAPATPEAAQWAGWGSALKPAHEPIILCRKPLDGTLAANVLAHGVGGLNIDACRVETSESLNGGAYSGGEKKKEDASSFYTGISAGVYSQPIGRWPANILHDGSDEVMEAFAAFGERKSGELHPWHNAKESENGSMLGKNYVGRVKSSFGGDVGTAARFFYAAKASKADRAGSKHPTVKPLSLMRWLCTLITPPGGTILDPFAGSGTTLQAAQECGFNAIGIEREAEYVADIKLRLTKHAAAPAKAIMPDTADLFSF